MQGRFGYLTVGGSSGTVRSARGALLALAALVAVAPRAWAAEPERAAVVDQMRPYGGPPGRGIDRAELRGKLLCGYQGWFAAQGDGSGRGWRHYGRGGAFAPGACGIDLWPDVAELAPDELFATRFLHANGRTAHVFSSTHRQTVLRHFRWMRDYGIDGTFVQRFGVETRAPLDLQHCNTVLTHCREGANLAGRCYAVMYDLSLLPRGGLRAVIDDWKLLVDRMRIGRDEADGAYLRHRGRPLVAVWGIGFNDGRRYTLDECAELVRFLRHDPTYGGQSVMVGVPTGWLTLDQDCVGDQALRQVVAQADVVSPWTVGRYRTPDQAARHARDRWRPDLEECRRLGQDYLPVVFPGFSWANSHPGAMHDEIPRRRGEFFWRQLVEARRAGAEAIYVAMFDELDEGTAIFKCTSDVPVGESRFVSLEGLPSDHYLWLAGQGRRLLRGELAPDDTLPARQP